MTIDMDLITPAPRIGATIITKRDYKDSFSSYASLNSSLAIQLRKDQPSAKIVVERDAKFVMGSVCLDTDQFGPQDCVKLMYRFVGRDDSPDVNEGWSCLCNYLGQERGGKALSSVTQLGLEIMGGCVVELFVEGTVKGCSINLACNVLSTSSVNEKSTSTNEKSSCVRNQIAPPMNKAHTEKNDSQVKTSHSGFFKHLPIRSILGIILLLNHINQGGSGLTKSLPSLNPTRRLTVSASAERQGGDLLSGETESPRATSPSSNNLFPQVDTKQSVEIGEATSTLTPSSSLKPSTVPSDLPSVTATTSGLETSETESNLQITNQEAAPTASPSDSFVVVPTASPSDSFVAVSSTPLTNSSDSPSFVPTTSSLIGSNRTTNELGPTASPSISLTVEPSSSSDTTPDFIESNSTANLQASNKEMSPTPSPAGFSADMSSSPSNSPSNFPLAAASSGSIKSNTTTNLQDPNQEVAPTALPSSSLTASPSIPSASPSVSPSIGANTTANLQASTQGLAPTTSPTGSLADISSSLAGSPSYFSSVGATTLNLQDANQEVEPTASPSGSFYAVDSSSSIDATTPDLNDIRAPNITEQSILEDNCTDLAIAFLPSWVGEESSTQWSLYLTDLVVWSKDYSTSDLFNEVVIDHPRHDGVCLEPGSYTLNFTANLKTHYLVYSGGEVMSCGGVNKENISHTFTLPFDSSDVVSDCSALINCEEGIPDDCLKQAFVPLHCYNDGIEVDATGFPFNRDGNRNKWFSDTCSAAFQNVCKSGALGFGIGNHSDNLKEPELTRGFCPYFECANTPFQSYIAGNGSLDEFYGCECEYAEWNCNATGSKCDLRDCCTRNGVLSNATDEALSTGCTCRIEPDCDAGNDEMCEVALDYCCATKGDDFERKECEKKYSKIKCHTSIEKEDVDENGDYPYCWQNSEAYCEDDVDVSGCECKYWEDLCAQYPQEAVCEDTMDKCCVGNALFLSPCYCDFYDWSASVGYKSEFKSGWCSMSDLYMKQRSNAENDYYGLQLIYNRMGGELWYDRTGWNSSRVTPHCEWFGVECSQEGRVTHLKLNNNNLKGDLSLFGEGLDDVALGRDSGSLFALQELDLSKNNIFGVIRSEAFFRHQSLFKLDISDNQLSGVADVLISPSISYLNFSNNKFTSVGRISKSRAAYKSIEIIDLGNNQIQHQATTFFDEFPPNTKELILKDNVLSGTLPISLPSFMKMEVFDASSNNLTGTLPDFSRSMPRVLEIHLHRQRSKGGVGFSGSIPDSMSSLLDLVHLDLSSNSLTGVILPTLGNIPRLQLLNLSNNEFQGEIDPELGKLSDVSDVFDLSNNQLRGSIPEKMKDFIEGVILLGGNDQLLGLAPLGLCYDAAGFDLKSDAKYCPPERNALRDFFDAAKGREWTNSEYWGDQFTDPCTWYGVICNTETNTLTGLDLKSNGLSGKLSDSFGNLSTLESIDISDNDIKGSIPANLGNLANLRILRLSYNQFTSTIPLQLSQLKKLQMAHFQSNRLTGEIILDSQLMNEASSFVSDCGVPTDFDDPLMCTNCSMCCNVNGGCHTTDAPFSMNVTFEQFLNLTLSVVSGMILMFFVVKHFVDKYIRQPIDLEVMANRIIKEKQSALETIGKESIYCFFLTKNLIGWVIALSVITFQFFVFYFFVKAAEKDFSDDKSDFTYSWRCPRNSVDCNFLADQTPGGWFTFGVLMISHLGKDLVQGSKLVYMSTHRWHTTVRRLRFLVGGVLVILVTIAALYSSTVYNVAIARSNAELVENAVIVLFLVDVDEQLYLLMEVTCPRFLDRITGHHPPPAENTGELDPNGDKQNNERNLRWTMAPRWSNIDEGGEDELFTNNENGIPNKVDHSTDISDLYAKMHELEREMEEMSNAGGTNYGNHDELYHAQINSEQILNDLSAQVAAMELKTEKQFETIRLALQVQKSSTEMITDSVRYLHERTMESEEGLSQPNGSSERRVY